MFLEKIEKSNFDEEFLNKNVVKNIISLENKFLYVFISFDLLLLVNLKDRTDVYNFTLGY